MSLRRALLACALTASGPARADNALVEQSQQLAPTAAAAAALAIALGSDSEPVPQRLVGMHGDVAELETGDVPDCVPSWPSSYHLHVFVPRAALIPRLGCARAQVFADGTAVAIDQGAPLARAGAAWRSPALAAARLAIDPKTIVLATPPTAARAALAEGTGEQLACDEHPLPVSQWRAAHARDLSPPECGVRDQPSDLVATLAGKPVPWPREISAARRVRGAVTVDATETCARLRLRIDLAGLRADSLAATGTLRGIEGGWRPPAGDVFWPDGSPAGAYTGGEVYAEADITQRGDLACVRVERIAELVCHRRPAPPAKR